MAEWVKALASFMSCSTSIKHDHGSTASVNVALDLTPSVVFDMSRPRSKLFSLLMHKYVIRINFNHF